MKQLRRGLLIAAGLACVAAGIAGIFLPLLPTTPFLLLAAACFVRSSETLYAWLMNHRWFGSYLRDWREHRAIPVRAKVVTLLLLWPSIAWAAIVVVNHWALRGLLLVIALTVTTVVLRVRTLDRP